MMQFQTLHQQLKSNDIMVVLNAITQLSTELTMTQQESIDGYKLEKLMPELVQCLNKKDIPDIKSILKTFITNFISVCLHLHQSYFGHYAKFLSSTYK